MNFHVGQKVVCVDDVDRTPSGTRVIGISGQLWEFQGDLGGLRAGVIYTVRWVGVADATGHPAILLEEIPDRASWDNGFHASRFRPLIERKTDISIFTAMLNTQTVPLKQREKA